MKIVSRNTQEASHEQHYTTLTQHPFPHSLVPVDCHLHEETKLLCLFTWFQMYLQTSHLAF